MPAKVGWEWSNGRLSELYVIFGDRDVDAISSGDLRDTTLPILAKYFADLPEAVYFSVAIDPADFVPRDAKAVPNDLDWVINASVQFVEQDGDTAREALPVDAFVLWFPFIGGNLSGSPTSGDAIRPRIGSDYSFSIDLNSAVAPAKRSSTIAALGQGQLKISPSDLKMLRVATFALSRKTLKRVAYTGWKDAESGLSLILVYFGRACTISGIFSSDGDITEYQIEVPSEGR